MPSPYTDDEQSSDEEASLTAPTADAPTPSTYYGDVFESSSSGEDASSDGSSSDESSDNDSPCPETSGLHDNPTHIEDDIWNSEATMVSEEEDASNLVLNPSFHMQGDDVPYGSTTDNSEDDAVRDMQMHENTRTSSAQISETSHIEDNLHSDEDAPLTTPTADAPTASSSSEGSSSDGSSSDESSDNDSPCPERTSGLDDNPTRRPPIVPQVEVDASNLVFNPWFHMQGDDVPYGSTTDNSEDNAVPDNSEAVPDMQMHENTRTSSAQISETSHIEDNLHSDEDAPLTTPTADAPTAFSSSEGSSSDGSSSDESSDNDSPCPERTSGLDDNPTRRPPIVPQVEVDASNLVFNPSFHMQGDDVPYGSTTDNSEDNAVPDNSEAVPDMQMHENTRTSSAQISETSYIEDNLHSDEEASVCYVDLFDSSSSSEGSSSDGSYSGELSGNDSPCPDDMVVPSSSSFIGDDFHDVSTTDNFVDVAVPDNSEAVAVPDNSGDVAVPDNSEVVAFGVPGIQMHESPQPISSQISNPSNSKVNLQPTRRRRTAPAYFNDPESIGARVAKRKRGSIAPIELATPLDATNHFQEVSALLANERVSQQDFLQFSKKSIRSLQKAIASSKRALREAPK
ncbi:papilin-like [Drosophila subobscura]|uniref:papilin-like n=1 Tax=Drosophila subobscura TaxID=7241 RepID=UPI00155A0990|nr:papilin-like [Drosophila subobscura]